jgi:DNA-binding transcriptional regulator YdaS (Cro superfamily)
MTLHEFRTAEKMTLTALAARLGRPLSTVHGWVTGSRKPGWDDIPAIERATDGRVTAADFVPRQPVEAA